MSTSAEIEHQTIEHEPQSVARAIGGVQLTMPMLPAADVDTVGRCMLACLRREEGTETAASAIFCRYKRWCEEQSVAPLPMHDLCRAVRAALQESGHQDPAQREQGLLRQHRSFCLERNWLPLCLAVATKSLYCTGWSASCASRSRRRASGQPRPSFHFSTCRRKSRMSPQPIKSLIANPSINLVPEQVAIERPQVAAWIAQGIPNWSWIDTQIANLFIFLLGSNIRLGAELYANFESDRVKENTLRNVALAALSSDELPVFDALLRLVREQRAGRNKLAHWYWGVCTELKDGAVAVRPQYILRHRANLLGWTPDQSIDAGLAIDLDEVYAFRIGQLKADAKAFSEIAVLVHKFSNAVQIAEPAARAQLFRALVQDARLAEVLNRSPRRSDQKANQFPQTPAKA